MVVASHYRLTFIESSCGFDGTDDPLSCSLPSIGTISFHLNDPILRQIITQSDTNLEI